MARTLSLRQLFAACFVIAALVLVSDDRLSFVQVSRDPNGIAGRQLRDAMERGNIMVTVGSEQPELTSVSGNWVSASLPFVVSVIMGMLVAFGGVGAANAEDAEASTDSRERAVELSPDRAVSVRASTDSRERAVELDQDRAVRIRLAESRETAVELDKERAMRARMSPKVGTMSEAEVLRAEAKVFDRARAARVNEAGKVTGAQSSEAGQLRARAAAFDLERATRKQAASGDFPKPLPFNAAKEAVTESQKDYYRESIAKATEAEMANRAKAAAERDDKLNATAASTKVTSLQQQQTLFTKRLEKTQNNQLITERKKENKSNFTGYPTKQFVSPDAMPVDVLAPSLLAVGAFGIAQDIIIKGKQAKEQNQEDGGRLI